MEATQHTADDILNALRMGVDYSFTIRVRNLQVRVRPLSLSEHVAIVNDVTAEMSTKGRTEQNSLTESALLAMRMLEAATTPEPGSRQAPALTAAVMQMMTNDEVIALHRRYIAGCDILDPQVESLTEQQLTDLVEAAKKNDGVLVGLPPPHLVMLVRFLLTPGEQRAGNTSGG